MRLGQNPAKAIQYTKQPQAITAAVITYIPFLSGYYAQSLEVLKISLESLLANSDRPFDLMVFDNGSCVEVVKYLTDLQQNKRIQFLVLSDQNIGKVGAWNFIFGAAPGEYIAYSDSDIYFYPGWLSKHLRIFETYPEAGTVCGLPRRGRRDFYTNTIQKGPTLPDVKFEEGKFLREDWITDHARSLGKTDTVEDDLKLNDYRFTRNGVIAFATATHFQFMVQKKTILPLLHFPSERPMGDSVAHVDRAINQCGMLRLAVSERVVRHMGNTLDPSMISELTGDSKGFNLQQGPKKNSKFWYFPLTKKIVLGIYDRIFKIYYG